MKILITGANGLVGSACQRCANDKKYDFSIISRKEAISTKTKRYELLNQIPNEEREFDLLIHCAAATPNNSDFESIFESNSRIDENLCNFIKSSSIKHVIYLSTMAVYGEITDDILNEETEIKNPNKYGYSKLIGEKSLKDLCSIYNVKLSILRLPGVVGLKMPTVFFRRLYESILNSKEVLIRSRDSLFNNAVLDSDIFNTSIKLFNEQKENCVLLNHHSSNIITLGDLIDQFSEVLNRDCIYKQSLKCNPPFIIQNKLNDDLLYKSKISDMIIYFHKGYE